MAEVRISKPMLEGYDTRTGYVVDVLAVPYTMVEQLRLTIPDPKVPVILNKSKGTKMENPQDPDYIKAMSEVEGLREAKVRDAAIAFGCRIISPKVEEGADWIGAKYNIPPLGEWLPQIEDMENLTGIDVIADYDLENDRDVKILFIKCIVLASPVDLGVVLKRSIGLWDAAQVALDTFRNKEVR